MERKRRGGKPPYAAKRKKKKTERVEFEAPLQINSVVYSRWKVDSNLYACRVLERKQDAETGMWQYYLHYNGLDRRNEVWKTRDEIQTNVDPSLVTKPDKNSGHGSHGHSENIQQMRQYKKNVDAMILGSHKIECWYWSPIPSEFEKHRVLHFCDFCLNFFGTQKELSRHLRICSLSHPPGNEIYRSEEDFGTVAVFEVDGEKEWIYCQNVCYIAKLFLDHKTLLYDTNIFLFYIVCEIDDLGAHFVGYFSKDKFSIQNNLACILTLPPYQKKGYGRFLISLSYELSKVEQRVGTPERPLSDLGCVSYQRYWARTLLDCIERNNWKNMSLRQMEQETYISVSDIKETFESLSLIHWVNGEHVLCLSDQIIKQIRGRSRKKKYRVKPCQPHLLRWHPPEQNNTNEYQAGSLQS